MDFNGIHMMYIYIYIWCKFIYIICLYDVYIFMMYMIYVYILYTCTQHCFFGCYWIQWFGKIKSQGICYGSWQNSSLGFPTYKGCFCLASYQDDAPHHRQRLCVCVCLDSTRVLLWYVSLLVSNSIGASNLRPYQKLLKSSIFFFLTMNASVRDLIEACLMIRYIL